MNIATVIVLAVIVCACMAQFSKWSTKPMFYDLVRYNRNNIDQVQWVEAWRARYLHHLHEQTMRGHRCSRPKVQP